MPEDRLFLGVVPIGAEHEARTFATPERQRPAGERTSDFAHVILCITAIDAKRVQLHELARVVFIEAGRAVVVRRLAASLLYLLHSPRIHTTRPLHAPDGVLDRVVARSRHRPGHVAVFLGGAAPVVQVHEHRRAVGDGPQHLMEAAQHVRPNCVALVGRHEIASLAGVGEDVEVVVPEVDQNLGELPVALHGADDARRSELPQGQHRVCEQPPPRLLIELFVLPHPALGDLRGRVLLVQLGHVHRQARQPGQLVFYGVVPELLGNQLLTHVALGPELLGTLPIAASRAVGHPIQGVRDGRWVFVSPSLHVSVIHWPKPGCYPFHG